MNPREYEIIYRIQKRHFFYETRRRLYSAIISSHLPNGNNRVRLVLDAGCGSGGFFDAIGKYGRLVGCDISELAIRLCEADKCLGLTQSSINTSPFKNDAFDLVACLGVLYHRRINESDALLELYRVCKPGGIAFITVPAYQFLIGEKDLAVHTRHRYVKKEIAQAMRNAGFIVERCSYFYATLFIPMVVTRWAERLRQILLSKVIAPDEASSRYKIPPPLINKIMIHLLELENKIGLRIGLPFGVEIACIGRKRVKPDDTN